jgi:hypothetical protein
MKTCAECRAVKPLTDFYRHPTYGDGLLHICKACHRRRMKVRRLTNPRVQEYDRARSTRLERKTASREIYKKWRQDHPEAYRAQTAVGNAIRDGKLIRLPCFICGTTKKVDAHHKDYSQPFAVTWLCRRCHHRLHAAFPELGGHFETT